MNEQFVISRRKLLCGLTGVVGLTASGRLARAEPADAYAEMLARYVVGSPDGINRVRYDAWKATPADRKALVDFINAEARLSPSTMAPLRRFAFWTNLYNALTLAVVLEAYPVRSIRDIKSTGRPLDLKSLRGPWRTKVVIVEGQALSLEDIENGALRAAFRDPRVHYAINRAALGCPNLLARPWRAETLAADLDAAARAYINHPRGVTVLAVDKVKVSRVYKWFIEDFGGSEGGVIAHLRLYADPPLGAVLAGPVQIVGYDYDWWLNDARPLG